MNGGEDLAKSQAVAHGEGKLGDPLAGVSTHYGGPEYPVTARHRQHLDKALDSPSAMALSSSAISKRVDSKGMPRPSLFWLRPTLAISGLV